MFICKHEVQYYETDRMGITHHSNYVRWMEEARTFFLREIGWPYEKIEEEGIISPVTSISCDYKATSTFADEISIEIIVKSVKSASGYDSHYSQYDKIMTQTSNNHET